MKHKTTGGKLSLPRLFLMIALVTLCSFLFAGVALANGTLDIIPDASNPNAYNSVKASHTYDYVFDASNFEGVDTAAFYENPQDLFIKFPVVRSGDPADQFDLSPAIGRTIPVNVTVNGQVYYMQTVPTIGVDPIDGRPMASFDFQSANLAKTGSVERIEILGLRVKNTHVPSDSYKIEFTHYQPFLFTLYKSIRVVETVGEIVIDSPKTCTDVKAGSSFTVTGHVMKTCNVPWDYTSWPVKIEILDKKGRPAKMPVMNECPITYNEDGQPIEAGGQTLADMEPVCVSTTYNQGAGTTTFTGTLRMPAYQYKYKGAWTNDYVIKVSTIEVKDAYSIPGDNQPVAESIEDKADTTLVGCPIGNTIQARQNYLNIRHLYCDFSCDDTKSNRAIALSAPETIHMIPAEPVKITWKTDLNEIKLNKPVEVTFCFMDKYCNPAAILNGPQKVDLAAFYGEIRTIAGIFTDGAGNQIGHVYVPAGQSCVTVMFVPTVPAGITGPPYPESWQITIEARAENLTSTPSPIIIAQDEAYVIGEGGTTLELLAKVTNEVGAPVAGWPVKASFFVNNLGATQNYKLHVEITDETGKSYADINDNGMYDVGEEVACWGVDPGVIDFSYVYTDHNWYMGKEVGAPTVTNHVMGSLMGHNICQPWDTITIPFSTSKQHIWIYPKVRIERCTNEGYMEPTIAYPASLHVKVVIEGPAGEEVMVAESDIFNFVDPVELMRSLDADSWQTLSTPKTLAGTGDLNFLIGQGSYDIAYKYVNGAWTQLTPGEQLQPLYCYYVKMRQPKHYGTEGGNGCYWNAAYIFDRADGPQQMIPPVRTLGIGWNAVGMAIQDTNTEDDNNLWQQSDMLYRAMGTICEGCKIVYNPGFPKVQNQREPQLDRTRLGNLADFKTVAVSIGTNGAWWDDPYTDVYNGDNYWIYLTKAQDIAANVGLDVVDP